MTIVSSLVRLVGVIGDVGIGQEEDQGKTLSKV